MGWPANLRMRDGRPFVSDNGNQILDCNITPLTDPQAVESQIVSLPGVVGTGLFLGLADMVFIQDGETVQVLEKGLQNSQPSCVYHSAPRALGVAALSIPGAPGFPRNASTISSLFLIFSLLAAL